MEKISWKIFLYPIKVGGLGIGSLQASNLAMLTKWWCRFYNEPNALWCKIIKSIHGSDGGLNHNILPSSTSGLWKQLI